jgi:hypothetical protein
MRRPPSASMLLKQGEAMPRPYKQHSPFSATFVATHWVALHLLSRTK